MDSFPAATLPALVPVRRDKHVNFSPGMVLGVDDLVQEHAYHANRVEWQGRHPPRDEDEGIVAFAAWLRSVPLVDAAGTPLEEFLDATREAFALRFAPPASPPGSPAAIDPASPPGTEDSPPGSPPGSPPEGLAIPAA